MIDFGQIPKRWPLCGNGQCSKAGECLRHLAFQQVPQTVTRWQCVLPTAMEEDGGCRYFRKAETVRMARGFKGFYNSIKNKYIQHEVRVRLTQHLGSKGSYYRYRDGERWMNPGLQQMIADMAQELGLDAAPIFDEYADYYDFTAHAV